MNVDHVAGERADTGHPMTDRISGTPHDRSRLSKQTPWTSPARVFSRNDPMDVDPTDDPPLAGIDAERARGDRREGAQHTAT